MSESVEPWDAPEYVCGECGRAFVPTDSQRKNRRHRRGVSYCAPACRYAAVGRKCRAPIPDGVDLSAVRGARGPVRGPCKRCGVPFRSSSPAKLYCSMDCYQGSDDCLAMLRENARRINEGKRVAAGAADPTKPTVVVTCQHCGTETVRPFKWRARRFCNRRCWRGFYAARFDRWIANPESIALPQNYDEFLDRDELPCVVEGCGWVGTHLSTHCNHVHGLTAPQLKEMLGFNKTTGLCGRAFSEFLAARPGQGRDRAFMTAIRPERATHSPVRAEGREHGRKASTLMARTIDPDKPPVPCRRCGVPVPQRIIGAAYYCGLECRNAVYRARANAKRSEPKHPLTCSACGAAFMGTDDQKAKSDSGRPVNCRKACWTWKRRAGVA